MEDYNGRPSHLLELEREFEAVEDISDRSLMDCLLTYLENIQNQDETFLEVLTKIRDEMIVTWPQPWYQQHHSLTRPLKEVDDEKLEKFRTDTICSEESAKIHKNWREFRKIFRVPNTPECLARWRNKESRGSIKDPKEYVRRFVMCFLAQGLERNLYQVYKHFIVKYSTPLKGSYLTYEENIMDICLHHCPKYCVPFLSTILGREPRGLYKRLVQKMNGDKPDRIHIKWDLSLATKLLHALMQVTGESLEGLKNKKIDKSTWLVVEDLMGINSMRLQSFWSRRLHTQLFVKYDIKIRRLRKNILKQIRLRPYKVWRDIRWNEITSEFPDGFTRDFLYDAIRKAVLSEGYRQQPLEDVIQYGLLKAQSLPNRRLKTLVLNENQELEIIQYDNKLKF